MSGSTKAAAATAQTAPHSIVELRMPPEKPRQFRNKKLSSDALWEQIDLMNTLQERVEKGSDAGATSITKLLTFVAECYFEEIPWAGLLHYIVNNIADRPELRLYEAIIQSRTLYLLLND